MARTLKVEKPAGEAVRSLARSLAASAERDLRQAADLDNVHQARRSLKRLRSLIRLIRPAIGKSAAQAADQVVRLAADGLAGARRQEALSLAATRLELADEPRASLQLVINQKLGPDHSQDRLQERVKLGLGQISAFRRAAKRWPLPKAGRRFCIEGLKCSYAMARKTLNKALASDKADDLHEARKHVIHNLHHLDMLRPLWPEILAPWSAELTVLREALGDFNDLDELRSLAGELPDQDRRQVYDAIAKAEVALVKIAAHKAGRVYAEKPSAFAARMEAMWETASGK